MIYLIVSIILVAVSIVLAAAGLLWWAVLCGVVASWLIVLNYRALQKSKSNVITVLKAVKNNDHSFYLKEDKRLGTNSEINHTLNQIKELIQATQKEVRDQELFLSSIIEQVPTGIIITTSEGTVRFINHAALSYLSLPIVTHLHRIRQVYPELYSTITAMQDDASEGVTIQTEKAVQELIIERTTVELASGVVHIITLNDINHQLDQRETDSWMSLIRVMTHEIMNSIAPIRSISEMLLDQDDSTEETTRQALRTIHDTSDHLIRFVEDYRRFSAVPQPQPEPLATREIMDIAATLITKDTDSRAITLRVEIGKGSEEISADKNLLMQVIQNLLKNAIEATPDGGEIIISSGIGDNRRPFIRVYNSGNPIAEEIKPYIFIPFFTTKEGGSGVGLSLSRYIMRLHGGNLRYQSQRTGNTFVIEF